MPRAEEFIIAANPNRAKQRLGSAAIFLALGVETYLLLSEKSFFTPDRPRANAPVVAELVSASNSVKLQAPGDLVWNPGAPGAALVRKQSVLTGKDSRAEVAFLDGSGLVLDEESLIQVERSPSAAGGAEIVSVRLLRGAIHKAAPTEARRPHPAAAFTQASIEVQVGDAKLSITPDSDVSLRSNGEFIVRAGEVALTDARAPATLRAGEEGRISSDGQVSSRKLPFLLLSPRANELLGEAKVRFRWDLDTVAVNGFALELELSRDPAFKSIVARKTIPAASRPLARVETELELPAQDQAGAAWYWRVRAIGKASLVSSVEKFHFQAPSPRVELKFPPSEASARAGQPVDFSWTALRGATRYELEILSGGAGVGVRASREPFVRIEQLPAAELDWRVRAVFQDSSKSDWSSPRKLRVLAVDEEETLPPPNELFDPTIAPQPSPSASPSAFWLDLLKRILISSAHAESPPAPERYQVQLKWTPVKGASKYRVQISKSRAFRDPKDTLIEVQTEAPQWVWEYERGMENSKGRVFYRVASVSASGKVGNFSSPKPIDLRVAAKPVVETPLKAKVPAALQTFDATENASASEAVDALAVHEESRRKQATDTGLVSVAELEAPTTSAPSSQWSFSLGVGAAGQSQSGDGSLASVAFGSPYLQQHWELEGMTAPRNQSRWTARLVGNVASFERGASDSDPRMPEQPEVAAFRLRLDVLRETPDVSRGVQWALGLSLDRAYRWQKTGLQTVDAVNSISAGPGLWGSARLGSEGRLNAMLTVPALGLLIGQHASATGSLSADWPVWKLSESWVSARVQFEGTYMMWNRPLPTRATNWAFWIAPTLHLGSSDRKGGS